MMNGEINFTDYGDQGLGLETAAWKRTAYGYTLPHDGRMIENSPAMLKLGLRRHFAQREPQFMCGYDTYLRNNQKKAIRLCERLFCDTVWRVVLEEFGEGICESAERLAQTPHPKLALRKADWEARETDGSNGATCWLRTVEMKLKTVEWAKTGKYGRIIVDLGVGASLQGAAYAEWCKKQFGDQLIEVDNCCFWFITTPDPEIITAAFKMLLSNTYSLLFVVFSDDCCVSFDGGETTANFDISSCDMSHEPELFDLFFKAFKAPFDIEMALRAQIMAPIKIHNPTNRDEYIIITPNGCYLQSGSTITTITNVCAWFLIFCWSVLHHVQTPSDLVEACRQCGYIVTYDVCQKPEDIQFLKMSPTLTADGEYYATLNLGVILRASGVAKGDLQIPAAEFQTLLMSGLLAYISNPELELLSPKVHVTREQPIDYSTYSSVLGVLNLEVGRRQKYTIEALVARYDLTSDELDELIYVLKNLDVGRYGYPTATRKIYQKDYGLDHPSLLDLSDAWWT